MIDVVLSFQFWLDGDTFGVLGMMVKISTYFSVISTRRYKEKGTAVPGRRHTIATTAKPSHEK